MQYIDKLTDSSLATSLKEHIQGFIEAQWNEEDKRYVNLRYEALPKQALYEGLTEEQHGFCCYCMRSLTVTEKKNVTLEHVIPHKLPITAMEELARYQAYAPLHKTHVQLTNPKRPITTKITAPPYPHFIAYENLVASCDGKFPNKRSSICCNNKRGNAYVDPLFYIETISEEIIYFSSGTVGSKHDTYKETIDTLGLNDLTLKFIRKIWFGLNNIEDKLHKCIPKFYSDPETNIITYILTSTEDQRGYIADKLAGIGAITDEEKDNLKQTIYWKIAEDFFWFAGVNPEPL